ncbi:MAG: DUF1616 domain-containing protein [Chloroflexales bacterium]|nr:DUF1616 domain-containing protein [Chloroflexales bacterium]
MSQRTTDMIVIAAIIIIAVTLVDITMFETALSSGIVRVFFALLMVLVLPGYAITAALFPGRMIGAAERLLFSVGLSMVVAILGGLILNWMPAPIHASAWSILLAGTTITASIIAFIRRREIPPSEAESPGLRFSWPQGLLGLLVVGLVSGAFLVNRMGVIPQRTTAFTQFWMLPANPADPNSLRLGVRNHELREMNYKLQVTNGTVPVGEWPLITLGPDELWESTIALPAIQPGMEMVEALLYRLEEPDTVYRRVLFWRDNQ